MVAASKLRRSQERIQQARPYALQMQRVLNSLASRVDPSAHPLLDERRTPKGGGRALLIVITADRGLCGSFNTNVIKAATTFAAESAAREVALGLVGRRGRDYFVRRSLEVVFERVNIFATLKYEDAKAMAQTTIDAFLSGEVDSVHLAYNEFKSVMQQHVVVEQLLPIPRGGTAADPKAPTIEYRYEPAPDELLARLVPSHIEVQIYRALLESAAAEHAARMTAMDAATRNSADMIEELTLHMNKVRQAAITREIIEVVSGAQAL